MTVLRPIDMLLISTVFCVLTGLGIYMAVQKADVEKRLEQCTKAYQSELVKDKSWDCNPEIKELLDDLEKAERESAEYQQKYLELWVEEIEAVKR